MAGYIAALGLTVALFVASAAFADPVLLGPGEDGRAALGPRSGVARASLIGQIVRINDLMKSRYHGHDCLIDRLFAGPVRSDSCRSNGIGEQEADGRPVYQQIAEAVRAAIARDGLGSGARLPAIRDLARELGVHRDTVATAYEALAADGVIESTVGPRHVRGRRRGEPRARRRAPFAPALSPVVERLLEFERARPRFGSARDAVAMHALSPTPRSIRPSRSGARSTARSRAAGRSSCSTAARRATPRCARRSPRACATPRCPSTADELVLCHGASQGIALALRLFCAPGDVVALEEPTYNNVLGAALALGLRTAPVPMRDDGVDLARLEQTLARPEVKAFYTIPTFHNPMGTTTGLAHRRALLAIARRAGVPVIEDGYEMDLRFAGAPVPPLAGLDASGARRAPVLVLEVAVPGRARRRGVGARAAARGAARAQARERSLRRAAAPGRARRVRRERRVRPPPRAAAPRAARPARRAARGARRSTCPRARAGRTPEGGYQVWLELPGGVDTRDLLADAVAPGVLFAPGSQFYSDGRAVERAAARVRDGRRGRAAARRRAARARGRGASHATAQPRRARARLSTSRLSRRRRSQ